MSARYTLLSIHPDGYGCVMLRPSSRYKAYKMRARYNTTPQDIAFSARNGITYKVVPVDVAMNRKHLLGREYL